MRGINKKKSVISQYCNQQRVVVCAFKALVKLPKSYKSAVCEGVEDLLGAMT